jgi:arylsulfatase A-like enzyme
MVESRDFKYVRNLPSNGKTSAGDILYDLRNDPNERVNVADKPENRAILEEARARRLSIHENFPSCQTRWTTRLAK